MNEKIVIECAIYAEDIQSEINNQIASITKAIVNERVSAWGIRETIKKEINKSFDTLLNEAIEREFKNSKTLEMGIKEELERQLRMKISRLIKEEK